MFERLDFDLLRKEMVDKQLLSRDIRDQRVLEVFRKVPRHNFVPEDYQKSSYGDFPLPIGDNQTISQPYIVALMTQLLELKEIDKVLEIGTGSGYQTAILAGKLGEGAAISLFIFPMLVVAVVIQLRYLQREG